MMIPPGTALDRPRTLTGGIVSGQGGLGRVLINFGYARFAPIVLKNSVLKPTVMADSFRAVGAEIESMMGPRQVDQAALFYEFSLERHVPATHLLRSIDRFVDLSDVRSHLAPFYSSTGLRLIPNFSSECCWLATATAFVPNGGCARRCT